MMVPVGGSNGGFPVQEHEYRRIWPLFGYCAIEEEIWLIAVSVMGI